MNRLRKIMGLLLCCTMASTASIAQNKTGVTHSGHLTGQPPFPINTYNELANPVATDMKAWSKVKGGVIKIPVTKKKSRHLFNTCAIVLTLWLGAESVCLHNGWYGEIEPLKIYRLMFLI